MNTNLIACPRCKSVIAVSNGDRVCIGGTTAVCHRVTLTCLRCGAKRSWRPSPAPGEKGGGR